MLQAPRLAVLGPGEKDPIQELRSIQILRSGPEARLPLNDTLFRKIERKYKRRTTTNTTVNDIDGMYDNILDTSASMDQLKDNFPDIYSYKIDLPLPS